MRVNTIFEQGTGIMNEDFHIVNGNLFGVFDGATSLNQARFDNGVTGGFLASNIAGEVFRQNHAPLVSLADEANCAICEAMKGCGVDLEDKGNLWSTSAAVVRVHEDSFEWVQIGDSLVLAVYEDGAHEVLASTYDHDRDTLCLWREVSDRTDESILAALHEQILSVRKCMNVTYGVFSGEKEAMSFLNHGRRNLEGIAHLLLFTDGLFIPKCDPDKPVDFERFVELYLDGGLSLVRDHIRNLEATDEGCRIYPRFKTHDDIAAISIDFS